jgi:copper homeostasis protein (lipoprotein)
MKRILPIGLVLFAVLAGGLSINAQDNSRTSLDWNGIYSGILPCADCQGIKTDIDLHPEGTYSLARRYLGKDDSLYTEYGTFQWNEQGSMITLENTSGGSRHLHFLVGENHLTRLDEEGRIVQSELAEMQILWKAGTGPFLTNRYWSLSELRGENIEGVSSSPKVPFLILWSVSNRVTGNAGCNTFTGKYEVSTSTLQIHFSEMATTQMICPQMELEDQLLEVIEMSDNYSLSGDTLTLNRARMAPLAKFVIRYFE